VDGIGFLSSTDFILNLRLLVIFSAKERIVCIRIKVKPTPILIVSVYMPCRGNRSGDEEYKECLDILFEITRKYHIDHRIVAVFTFYYPFSIR
jgi:hypothetical protein